MDDGERSKREDLELECENGGKRRWCEADPLDGNVPVVETPGQNWTTFDRKVQHECADSHQRDRVLCWAGHVARMDDWEICAKALRCRGLQWWQWRQLYWKEVEKDKWAGPHPQRFNIYRWDDTMSAEVSKVCGSADGFAESAQQSTGSWAIASVCEKGENIDLKVWWRRMVTSGDEWWRRVASILGKSLWRGQWQCGCFVSAHSCLIDSGWPVKTSNVQYRTCVT